MQPTLPDLLSACGAHQLGSLLYRAATHHDEEAIRAIVDFTTRQSGDQFMPMGPIRNSFVDLSAVGRWDLCRLLLPLFPDTHIPWMRGRCWEAAAAGKDSGLLDHIDTFGLGKESIPVHQVVESDASALFLYIAQHRPDQLPDLSNSNRSCAPALRAAAGCGEETCLSFVAHLRNTRQPQELVEDKLQRVTALAWKDAFRKQDAAAATTLARLDMWGLNGPEWISLFDHSTMGAMLCQDATIRDRMAAMLLELPSETMDEMSMVGFDALLRAGLPILEWRSANGEHVGHQVFRAADNNEEAVSWLLLEHPMLMSTPSTEGKLPTDVIKNTEQEPFVLLAQRLKAYFQAAAIDDSTPSTPRTPRTPRL